MLICLGDGVADVCVTLYINEIFCNDLKDEQIS